MATSPACAKRSSRCRSKLRPQLTSWKIDFHFIKALPVLCTCTCIVHLAFVRISNWQVTRNKKQERQKAKSTLVMREEVRELKLKDWKLKEKERA